MTIFAINLELHEKRTFSSLKLYRLDIAHWSEKGREMSIFASRITIASRSFSQWKL